MFKKSIKGNIWVIGSCCIFSVILLIIGVIADGKTDTKAIAIIALTVWILSFLIVAYSVFDIVRSVRWNKELSMLPYDFNFNLEYEIYNLTGKKTKGKKAKEIQKHNITIPQKYSEWKKRVEENYSNLSNIDDFYRFLCHTKRMQEINYDAITSVTIPLEVALVSLILTFLHGETIRLIGFTIMALFITAVVVKEMKLAKGQIYFIDDLDEILFPEKVSSRGNACGKR